MADLRRKSLTIRKPQIPPRNRSFSLGAPVPLPACACANWFVVGSDWLDRLARFFQTRRRLTSLIPADDLPPARFFALSQTRNRRNQRSGEKKGRTMNPFLQNKTILLSLLIGYIVVCFGVLPKAHAVVPPPDGGYANFTTAEGTNALLGLTSGAANTGVGWSSLLSVTTGSFNTGVGAGTLALNTADSKYGHWRCSAFAEHHRSRQHCQRNSRAAK